MHRAHGRWWPLVHKALPPRPTGRGHAELETYQTLAKDWPELDQDVAGVLQATEDLTIHLTVA